MRVGDGCRKSKLRVRIESERQNRNASFRNEVAALKYIPDFEIQNFDPEHIRLIRSKRSESNEMGQTTQKIIRNTFHDPFRNMWLFCKKMLY